MQVEEFLENSAKQYPNKVALIVGEERLTYRQIDEESNRLAHALIAAGVVRGDRVVTFLPNSALAVFAIFATLKAGAVFVVLNPSTKPDKLTYILNNCRASAMITWGGRAFFRSNKLDEEATSSFRVHAGRERSADCNYSVCRQESDRCGRGSPR